MQRLISNIIKHRTPCFFISPHLDDAVLSAGGLLRHLVESKVPVKVVTIFTTTSPPPYIRFVRNAMRNAGYTDMARYYQARRAEDRAVMGKLGVEHTHLGFVEASQRKLEDISTLRRRIGRFVAEVLHRYPTGYHIFSGRVCQVDNKLIQEVKNKLLAGLQDIDKNVVFCPVGLGLHVDHILVRDICAQLFKNIIYWEDFPYNVNPRFKGKMPTQFIQKNRLTLHRWNESVDKKGDLIEGYQSQLESLFRGKRISLVAERLYTPASQGRALRG